jgi:hypothetical protein
MVIFDPRTANFRHFRGKKEDLTGFAIQQATPITGQYWVFVVVVLTRNYYKRVTF